VQRHRDTLARALIAALLAWSTPAAAQGPDVDELADSVIEALGELPPPGFDFRAWINANDAAVLAVGSDIVFHLKSDRATNVTLIYLDQDAVVSLPIPTTVADAGLLNRPGQDHVVSCAGIVPGTEPEPDCGFEAYFPLGFDLVWAIASPQPIPLRELGGSWTVDEGLERLRPDDGPQFAKALVAHLREPSAGEIAWVRLDQAVLELGEGNPDVLNEYVKQRSLRGSSSPRRYRMPSIFFDSNSAALDARARRSLDTVARAMQQPEYATATIRLIGHADAIGPADVNEALSRQRAEAARSHLKASGLQPSRIEVAAKGEAQPLSPGTAPDAYQRNRRVELDIQP
jgi:outer membrane protein OmpA-like peptidoglycan-associated protein